MICKVVEFTHVSESDGKLSTFEPTMIPGFNVKRFFWIYDTPEGVERANHACMNASIILIAILGTVVVSVENNGQQEEYILNKSYIGLIIPQASWIRAYNFTQGTILLGLSDKSYQNCEYINDYETYLKRLGVK